MTLAASFRLRRGAFRLEVDLSLTAPVTALFGPGGSGKTTLLHAVAGILRPDAGRISVAERTCYDGAAGVWVPPHRRRVGMVFQDLRLFPHRSVRDNLLYGWRQTAPGRLSPDDIAAAFELGSLLERRPDQLSGGERQRVALGRALLAAPDLLLLDEPLAAVDVALRRQILPYLRWVIEHLGTPMVYVSHSLPEILDLTEEVVVLQNGRVAGQGEVFEVLGRTVHGELTEPFATDSLLRITVRFPAEDGSWLRATVGDQELMLPFAKLSGGTVARVAVRPEDVILAIAPMRGISARNQLRGRVARVSGLHGRLLVHVGLGGENTIRAEITREALVDLGLQVGSEVWCVVKTSAFRWQR